MHGEFSQLVISNGHGDPALDCLDLGRLGQFDGEGPGKSNDMKAIERLQ